MDAANSKLAEPAAAIGDQQNQHEPPHPSPPLLSDPTTATRQPSPPTATTAIPSSDPLPLASTTSDATATRTSSENVATAPKKVKEVRWQEPLLSAQKDVVLSQPHHSQDLISLCKVSATAARVARFDPTNGEKINRLRKSYEGQIKSFQLAGRNKAVKYEPGQHGMGLLEMAQWPEFEWRNQKVGEKVVSKGLSGSTRSLLDKAFKLEPGPVSRNDEWETILGHEKIKHGAPPSPRPGNKTADGVALKKPVKMNGFANGTAQEQADGIRARRTGKRRRYDDDSFEGYGEGFVDDDREDAGYSSDERSSKKKRRKEFNAGGSGMGAYGMAVSRSSIGSGIGAFGAR